MLLSPRTHKIAIAIDLQALPQGTGQQCALVAVLSPSTLDRSAASNLAGEIDNGTGRILMRVQLHKGKATVGLHPDLDNVAVVREERD